MSKLVTSAHGKRTHKPLIINIRGNSGSGKTYLTREFMEKLKELRPCFAPNTESPEDSAMLGGLPKQLQLGYTGRFNNQQWAILGKYESACGGCDTIKTQDAVISRVDYFTAGGYNVWLEGLIMSTIYGSVGEYSEKYGDRWVFAYLDTPIEKCIARIKERRAAAGQEKELNETNTRNRVKTIERNREIVLEHGRRVVVLDHFNPLRPLLSIIRKEGEL